MKTLFILVAVSIATFVHAQGAWETVTSGTGGDLNAITFNGAELGIAVGNDGAALMTNDGGLTWRRLTMVEDIDFHDAAFTPSGAIVLVGEHHWNTAAVAVSYDSGANWWLPNVSAFTAMSSIAFVSSSKAFATVRGNILQSNDGGLTWTPIESAGMNDLTSVRFQDTLHGIVTGGTHDMLGFTMRTNDGGKTWSTDADAYIEPLKATHAFDVNHVWRIGGDFEYGAYLSMTADGGATWSQMVLPELKLSLNDIFFSDALHGVAVGGTELLTTVDGGAHWSQSPLVADGYVNRFAVGPNQQLWAVGSQGRILKQSQSPSGVPTGTPVSSIALLPNYPNPFSGVTEFHFSLSQRNRAALVVYGVDGKRIATVLDEFVDGGDHAIVWNAIDAQGRAIPNGTYIVTLSAGEISVSRRITIAH